MTATLKDKQLGKFVYFPFIYIFLYIIVKIITRMRTYMYLNF